MSIIKMNPDKTVTFDESIDLHLGRITLKTLRTNKDELFQVEISKDILESNGSVLMRSIRVAESLKKRGVVLGDIIMLCGVNHNDVCIPLIASSYLGSAIQTLSTDMTINEIKRSFSLGLPKIIFCDSVVALRFAEVAAFYNHSVEIVVFGDPTESGRFSPFSDFLVPTGTEESFTATDFDPATTVAFILNSSGTTGPSKGVCLTHKAIAFLLLVPFKSAETLQEKVTRGSYLSFSTLYWISGVIGYLYPCILGFAHIHCADPFSFELARKGLEKYKPTSVFLSPVSIHTFMKDSRADNVDWSSVNVYFSAGGSASFEVITRLQKLLRNGIVLTIYGMTECLFISFTSEYKKNSIGQIYSWISWRIVDPETEEEIKSANKVGELRIKFEGLFKEYYNDPAATAEAYDCENWFKTGDLVYCDEKGNFYIVGRLKQMFKYMSYQIAPIEVENEIAKIPGVLLSAVVGLPHPDDGHHPMAFVQLCEGANISAQTIKTTVKDVLSECKQLRGGVVFLDKFPLTLTGKIDRRELEKMKMTVKRE